jgi:RHS repeat-associated protein
MRLLLQHVVHPVRDLTSKHDRNGVGPQRTERRRYAPRLLLLALGLLWMLAPAAPISIAQDYQLQAGAPPFTEAEPVESGFVNLANGNLHLEIPLGAFPQRGGRSLVASMVYDSRIWTVSNNDWAPGNIVNFQGGWRFVTSANAGRASENVTQVYTCHNSSGGVSGIVLKYDNFFWNASDGSTKNFPGFSTIKVPVGCSAPYVDTPTGSAYANDGSGYFMAVTSYSIIQVFAPDGTQVTNTTDLNGNYFSSSGSAIVDTLDREPMSVTTTCNGNANQTCYDILNSQGNRSRTTVTTTSIPVSTNFQSVFKEFSGTITVVQSIGLPDGTSYTFGYDSGTAPGNYGLVTGITLPTGGHVTYGYTNFTGYCPGGVVFTGPNRWVNSRTTPAGTWTHTYATPQTVGSSCQMQMTLTRPSNDNLLYSFEVVAPTLSFATLSGSWLTQVQAYAGTVSAANLAITVATTWNSNHTQKTSETVTLPSVGGASISHTRQFAYDNASDQNVSQVSEWKFYTGGLPGTPDRIKSMTYTGANSSYQAAHIIDKLTNLTVKSGSGATAAQTNYLRDSTALVSLNGVFQHDDTNYGAGKTIRGNLTSLQRCLDAPACSKWISASSVFDTTGQHVQSIDGNGNTTSYGYSDSFFDDNGANPPQPHSGAPQTNAYLTNISHPLSTNESFGYYYGSGHQESHADLNRNVTYFHYVDPFDRPTATKSPDGGSITTTYTGQNQSDSYTAITSSINRQDEVILDNLGRKMRTTIVSDPEGSDSVDFAYDALGRLSTVTNPHRAASSTTDGSTATTYDALDRILTTTKADGSQSHLYYGPSVSSNGGIGTQLCAPGTYGVGFPTLAVDDAQKKQQTWSDGFGRLIEVDEPDSTNTLTVPTCYKYDLLDNLTEVDQGNRVRTFAYDSTSRLTSATNPESGTITYTYDNNSNLHTKIDARGIVTTYSYDALNRLTQKSYSDGTPTATFHFDSGSFPGGSAPQNAIGRMTLASTSNTMTSFSYDSMGRIALRDVCTPMNCGTGGWSFTNAYDLAGDLTQFNDGLLPCNQFFNQSYDGAGRVTQVTSTWSDSTHPATFFTADANLGYYPTGALRKATLGNGLAMTNVYNSRLQPCFIDVNSSNVTLQTCIDSTPAGNVLDLAMNYNFGAGDNGNVVGWNATGVESFIRSYAYDSLNRLSTMADTATTQSCKGLSWTYDAWGNRTDQNVTAGSCGTFHATVGTNNRLSGLPYQYDAAGNLIADGNHTYTYDAEDRLRQVDGGATASYVYDAVGRRAKRIVGSNSYEYVYDKDGQLTWELLNGHINRTYIRSNGRLLAEYFEGTTYFLHPDHIGSTRLLTRLDQSIRECDDYAPFGEANPCGDNSGTTLKFTGKERDSESGLDNFGARYDSSSLGRFMSPDPNNAGAFLDAPQSWNAYSYVLNNPLNAIDPTGLDCVYAAGASDNPNSHEDGSATVIHGDCINLGGKNDSGVFVDNDENHPVRNSDVSLSDDGGVGIISYTRTDGLTRGYACIGNCSAYTTTVMATAQPESTTGAANYDPFDPQPLKFSYTPPSTFLGKAILRAGCAAGLPSNLIGPIDPGVGPVQDSTDSTRETQGQRSVSGPGKNGRPRQYNSQGNQGVEKSGTAVDVINAGQEAVQCTANGSTPQ